MENLVRGIKNLVTRLLPSSYFPLSPRISPSISSSTTLAPSPSQLPSSSSSSENLPLWKNVTDSKASVLPVLDRSKYSSASPFMEEEKEELWKRIKSVTDPEASVVPVLDGWIREGNTANKPLLRSLIPLLQLEKRYSHALEISNELCYKDCIPSDVAIRARLFQRTYRLEHVEAYFKNLFDRRTTYYDYVTLLCYYVNENYVEKAEAIMQDMREKGIVQNERSVFHYNLFMDLYSRQGDFEKMNIVMQKMGNVVHGIRSSSQFQSVLRGYVETGRKNELYQVWNTYKHSFYHDDKTFSFMMSYMLKLGDIKGAARIAEEWDSQRTKILDSCKKCIINGSELDSQCTEHSGLWERIKNVKDPQASVVPVLDQWICEGNSVEEPLLRSLIGLLRGYRFYNQATEISHWMHDCQYSILSPSCDGAAVRLRVIHRTRGLEDAETYFKECSESSFSTTYHVYCALLFCYVEENSVQKAEAIMEKMIKKGMAKSPYPYNLSIRLYSQNGDFEKINIIIQEMERNGIFRDKYTMRYLMAAYVAASNISGMEKILNQINKDPQLVDGWPAYATAANGYLKFGLIEPALTVLRKMEKMMPLGRSTKDFECLLSLYAKTGRKDELFRVWNTYKSLVELNGETFCCMISLLSKLEDINSAESIFKECESQRTKYDIRVLNKLLTAYCYNGLLEKAEAAVAKTAEGGRLYQSTLTILARGYVEHDQMSKAVETFKKAISVGRKGWKPDMTVLNACFDYLKAQGDAKSLEEIIKLLKSKELLTRDMHHRLG
ncbi:pentatricopeptide repeat-containing protein At2g20710, mitochondrial-like isoform X2 [Euphorbia lathyris]|uniref:pentatricopeptide repeat-containing protein At2g20710, mitochondrial-like isoform X2 n=1 Tax=Euphorbia lathyris TaxID=212925 RepID=UPI0033138C39